MHRPLLRRPPPYQSALWQRRNVAVATSQRLTIFHRCRRYLLISFSLVVLAGFATGPAAGANRVDLCGSIATDTVLTAGSVYVLTCVTTVEPQATLRLEPGAVIKLAIGSYNPAELVIQGNLEVMGTAEAPVVFTSLQDDQYGGDTNGDGPSFGEPGQWSAITFASGSRGRISHAIIRYGGGYYYHYSTKALIRNFSNDVALDHVELSRSANYGLYAEHPVTVTHSRVAENGNWGLYYYRLEGEAEFEITDNVFAGLAGEIAFNGYAARVQLRGNRIEGAPAMFSVSGLLSGRLIWDNTPGFALAVLSNFQVGPHGFLSLRPGSVVKLAIGSYNPAELVIRGNLEVMGTAEAPVVFTSLQDDQYGGDTNGDGPSFGEPGQWSAITFASGSRGRISHAIIRYGGGYYYHYSTKALIRNFSNDVALDHVELSRSRLHGVYTENGPMALRNCKITGNAGHGILNYTPRFTVDARYNWWGDASGPLHTRNNPNGSGDRVSDGVLFFPWAVDEYGAIPTQVLIQGPTRISPGDTVEYAVSYFVTQPLQEAVLVVDLPAMARYLDATGDAVLWPERNQVYWRLGDRGPAEGSRSLRLLYEWGLPDGSSDNILARLLALNLPAEAHLDVNEYLQHNPRLVTAEVLLSDSELRTQLTAHGDLSHLFEAAIGDGFLAPRARWLTTNLGERVLEVMLIAPERGAVIYLALHDGTVAALRYDRSTFQVYDVHGGLEWDVELDRFTFRGSWRSEASPTRGSRAVASFSRCFFNCAAPKLSLAVIKKTFKSVGVAFKLSSCFSCGFSQGANVEACAKCENAIKPLLRVDYLPGLGENVPVLGELIDVTKCASSCAGQQGVVFPCTAPLLTCDTSVTRHIWTHVFEQCSYRRIPCESGVLVPEKSHVVNSGCATDFCKCVEGKGCQRCSGAPRSYLPLETRTCDGTAERAGSEAASTGKDRATTQADSACSIARTAIRVAHDPNAKHSPAGDVVPGQELVYSVEYENTGAGRAYGVYIVDQLDPHLDETTLDLAGNGSFSPATRTIVWDIGELPAAGEEGAKGEVTFRVRVRSDVPAGTVITNQATVHFPSVPEETRTNATVNVVQPLVAIPQTLETFYRTALPLDLSGGDLFGSPLRYSIIEGPLNGTLSGLPPTLVYMPFENFTGPDWFAFVVANETKRSRPARVTIFVHPSSADRVPPQVLWTYPEHGSFLHEVPTTPFLQDEHGPLYAPSVRVGFSEAMDPNTITEASVTVTTTTGRQVATLVRWDDVSNQAVALPREPWQDGSYVATVNTAVRDASGNALPAEHSWSFGILTASSCVGDCNGDKEVTIDELVKGVNIALGIASLADCVAFETNDDGTVTVDELIQGVNAALTGCGA